LAMDLMQRLRAPERFELAPYTLLFLTQSQ
jgi:hypothetical protein